MSAYKEIREQYQIDRPQEGPLTGRRLFISVPSGTPGAVSSLPIVGTSLMPSETGTPINGLLCRRIRTTYASDGPQAHYHLEYSTRPLNIRRSFPETADPGDRTFDSYTETLSFPSDLAEWEAVDANNEVLFPLTDDNIYKSVSYEEFTIPRRELTDAQYAALKATMRDRAGTINASAFEGYAVGQVLFVGPRGATYTNQNGLKRWAVDLQFRARLLTGELSGDAAGAITNDDWLYIWKDYWVKPRSDGNFLYRKTNFSSLT